MDRRGKNANGDATNDDEGIEFRDAVVSLDADTTELLCLLKLLTSKDSTNDDERIQHYARIRIILDRYQEQGSSLDPLLPEIGPILAHGGLSLHPDLSHHAFQTFYILCKVRGYKTVAKVLPHDVETFEPVALRLLQTPNDFKFWESRYCLLVWLQTLALVPFDVVSMDSSGLDLRHRLVDRAKEIVAERGRTQEAAASFLSRFLSRKDMRQALKEVIGWCLEALDEACRSYLLAKVLKNGEREVVRKVLKGRWKEVVRLGREMEGKMTLERLYGSKLVQRMALVLLPPKLAAWRYSRGARLLFSGGKVEEGREEKDREGTGEECAWWSELEEEEDGVESVEDVVDVLLGLIGDRDTVVRWSAGKGLGRITARLPRILAVEISEAVLAVASRGELEVYVWHGTCLALAELARRGILMPGDGTLEGLIRVATKALRFDVKRGTASVGTQVRDAACYVCWALARAYSSVDISRFGHKLASSLVPVALLDREVNCRRAASAALQECVGRFTKGTIPYGLELLPLMDFYALADRSGTYLKVTPTVAMLGDDRFYFEALVEELAERKLRHWDETIRALASESLGRLMAKADPNMKEDVLASLAERATSSEDVTELHGALLGLAESLPFAPTLNGQIMERIRALVPKVGQISWQGKAGSLKLAATCRLVASLGSNHRLGAVESSDKYLSVVVEALKSSNEKIQRAGCSAAVGVSVASDENRSRILSAIASNMTQPGFALAASVVRSRTSTEEILKTMAGATMPESRRNAAHAVGAMVSNGDMDLEAGFAALIVAGTDYEVDDRGDVGSWVREAAMSAMADLVCKVEDEGMATKAVAVLLRQFVERIDRTRDVAAVALRTVFDTDARFTDVAAALEDAVDEPTADRAFAVAANLLTIDRVQQDVLLGLVASAGGLGPQASLASETMRNCVGIEQILTLYVTNRVDKRLSVPLVASMEMVVAQTSREDGAWSLKCAEEVCADLRGCRDVTRLATTINLLGELSCYLRAQERSYRALAGLLCHPVPRARRLAAEALYMRNLLDECADESLSTLLSDTHWESTSIVDLKPIRDQICTALNVTLVTRQ